MNHSAGVLSIRLDLWGPSCAGASRHANGCSIQSHRGELARCGTWFPSAETCRGRGRANAVWRVDPSMPGSGPAVGPLPDDFHGFPTARRDVAWMVEALCFVSRRRSTSRWARQATTEAGVQKTCPANRLLPSAGTWCRWPSSSALPSRRSPCWASLLSASSMGQFLTSTSDSGCSCWQERALVFGRATRFGGAEGSVWQVLLLPSLPFRACLLPCSYWLLWSPSPDGTDRRPSRIGVCRSFPRASVLSSAASSALRCGSRLSRMVPVKSGADARRFLHGPA
jgi:hypothetical protein